MTYEYFCTICQHQWEAEQAISAEPLRYCPNCNSASARRLVSGGSGFILKGGGWYADGYSSRRPASDSSSSDQGAKTSTSKQDGQKPATAKESTTSAAA